MRPTIRVALLAVVAGGLIGIGSSCSGTPTGENDGGHEHRTDAGNGGGNDAGTQDAGHDAGGNNEPIDAGHDAGQPDAGETDAGEVDAGEPDAGEMDAGCADPHNSLFFQVIDQDWGWPVMDPPCYTQPSDCNKLYTVRFTNQNAMNMWYANELQRTAPTVNFNLADVLVTYSCGCPTMGYSLKTNDVTANTCNITQHLTFEQPDKETCFVMQTFTRPFSTVEVVKNSTVTEDHTFVTKNNVCL